MQRAEAQHNRMQSQSAVRQGKGATFESPGGERLAQLEAMAGNSPQAGRQAQLAAMANNSSRMSAQRKAINDIHNSRSLTAQRQQLDSLEGMTAQNAQVPAQLGAPMQFGGRDGDEWDPGPGQGEQAPPTPRPGQGGQECPASTESGSLVQDEYSPRAGEERDESAQLMKAGKVSQLNVAQCAGASVKPNNTGLPDKLKSGIESLSGMSMDSVRVHYNSSQPAQLNALAYAQGTDIHVAPGQEQHLPHEAWHVVQQVQGRVKPTMQMKGGVPVNDDAGLEHEADVMGGKALEVGGAVQRADRVGKTEKSNLNSLTYRQADGRAIQRATTVRYNPDLRVTPRKRIASVTHTRNGGVVSAAKTWVRNNGAASTIPGGSVCNHSKPYSDITPNINNELSGKATINQVARTVKNWFNNLFAFAQAPNTLWEDCLDNMTDTVNNPEEEPADVNLALDWYLERIADYPRNLFYWPDQQQVGGGAAGATTTNEPGATNTPLGGGWANRATRAQERTRLTNARGVLGNNNL